MKLLLDQNISYKVVRSLEATFTISHVRSLGLTDASDVIIWQYAKDYD